MSNNLRTRIAKVLHRQFGPSLGAHPDGWDREPVGTREMYLEDADAVIRELLPTREGSWGWLDGTVSTNPQTGNPIKLEIEPGEVIPLSVDDARDVALALLAAVTECGEDSGD